MKPDRYEEIVAFLRDTISGTPWEGHLFTVGGCCRDMLMGLPIHDVDLAVSLPDGGVGFAEWLRSKKLTVGEPIYFRKYGTARLRLKAFRGVELELVQTRREKYTDRTSRNPAVAFGSIEDDCFRRDLTINSLYQSVTTGEVLDLTGKGRADIEAHIIRTPSDPDLTFDDDPVRILRAVRFAARFGWDIDPAAIEAMARHSSRLGIISPERLYGEFEKILIGPRPSMALDLLRRVGAIQLIIPEFEPAFGMKQSSYHFGTVWQHTLAAVDAVPADITLRMAALLHDIGKTVTRKAEADGTVRFPGHDRRARALVDTILRRFRCRKPFIDRVVFLCSSHEAAKSWGPRAERMSDAALRRLQHRCSTRQRFESLLSLIDADNRSYAPDHCMPVQVKVIRNRAEKMRRSDGGRSFYDYRLPIKPSRITRILGTRDEAALERATSAAFDVAYANPKVTREQLAEFISKNRAKFTGE